MKNFVLSIAVVFIIASLSGCGKKKDDASNVDGLSGVMGENVMFATDQNLGNEIAVIVDNEQAMATDSGMPMGGYAEAVSNITKPNGKQIQQALKNSGFYTGKIDGEVGPKTKKAIESFQAQNGLKADGKVGPKTWKALGAHLNKVPEVVNPSAEVQVVGQ